MSRFYFVPAFEKQLDKLYGQEASRVVEALIKFRRFLTTGEKTEGLGFKKIGPSHYEIRVDIHNRIGMKKIQDNYYVNVYGNHDDIERFLKNS